MKIIDQCSRKRCGWTGTDDDKKPVQNLKDKRQGLTVHDLTCPQCGCKEFYELRREPHASV